MLLPRVLTAAVGIPLILYVVHLGGVPFLALTLGLAALALYEYGLILWLGGRGVQRALTVAGGVLVALAVALSGPEGRFPYGFPHLAVTAVTLAAVLREMLRREHSLDRAALTVFGVLFIGWTLGHLPLIRGTGPRGEAMAFLLFAAVWATDTAAYFAGHAFGSRKLARVLSPGKTWEGAAGGLLAAVAVCLLARRYFLGDALSLGAAAGLGVLVGTAGQASDLAQSLVKRAAGAKDSAALLPGHGGVFDRMDSFLFLAPLFYWFQLLAGQNW